MLGLLQRQQNPDGEEDQQNLDGEEDQQNLDGEEDEDGGVDDVDDGAEWVPITMVESVMSLTAMKNMIITNDPVLRIASRINVMFAIVLCLHKLTIW